MPIDREQVRKRIISATLDPDVIRDMERIKKETGLSISAQIQLALKGYQVSRRGAPSSKRSNAKSTSS